MFENQGISHSNLRKGNAKISETKREERAESPTNEPASQPQVEEEPPSEINSRLPRGIQTTASVLKQRYGPRRQVLSEARQAIGAYIHDFALELGDQAPLRSTVTRAVRLYEESGLSIGDFIAALHGARSVVEDTRATSARGGENGRPAGSRPTRCRTSSPSSRTNSGCGSTRRLMQNHRRAGPKSKRRHGGAGPRRSGAAARSFQGAPLVGRSFQSFRVQSRQKMRTPELTETTTQNGPASGPKAAKIGPIEPQG